jgi:predicted acetyltransferase
VTEELVTLDPIDRSQAATLGNLLELYVHDFSELVSAQLAEDGRFGYSIDERWWADASHHPFFVRRGGRLSGFALVRAGSRVTAEPNVMDVAEFFVARYVRRQGVGSAAVRLLLHAFPGPWEVRVRDNNLAAFQFWQRALEPAKPTVSAVSIEGVAWRVLRVA